MVVRCASTGLIEDAGAYAERMHGGQRRKFEDVPYIVHPRAVVARLRDLLVPRVASGELGRESFEIVLAAAHLHDVVEDCGVDIHDIITMFGPSVAGLVSELTSDKTEARRLGKAEYLARKVEKMSTTARLIKLADREDNVSRLAITNLVNPAFVSRYVVETAFILDRCPAPGPVERVLLASIRDRIQPFLPLRKE